MNNINEERALSRLVEIFALERGYSPAAARQLRTAAALHDIGKQKMSGIINKPGVLDTREFEIVKTHTTLGADMLIGIQGELGDMARTICRYHHEWRNGYGYWGIRSGELPEYVEIVSICDVYTALRYERIYKPEWSREDAVKYIKKQADTQFSHELVNDFVLLIQTDSRVSAIFMDKAA